ncbi:MAG: P-loop NTPase [Phycisphaeraceae bacterium]|nr:P-loop NTPase [Phycisphaeraceae bacterium]
MPLIADNPAQPAPADQATRLRGLLAAMQVRADASPRRTVAAEPATRRVPVLAVASGKGGVGKTSIAVNLAICLAQRGVRTTLLDGDLGVANADVLLGVTPSRRLDGALSSTGAASLADIAVEAPGGILLVPGSVGIARAADLGPVERRRLADALVQLETLSDVVVIDTGAGVGPIVRSLVHASDHAWVVTTPEPTSITDAYALVKCLRQGVGSARELEGRLSLVVNQAADLAQAQATHARIGSAVRTFLALNLPLAGSVAQDPRVSRAVVERRPFVLGAAACPGSRAVHDLADRVIDALELHARATRPIPPGAVAARSRLRAWLGNLLRA